VTRITFLLGHYRGGILFAESGLQKVNNFVSNVFINYNLL